MSRGAGGAQKAWPCLQTLPLLPQGKHTGGGKSRWVQDCGRRTSGEAGRAAVAAGEAGGQRGPQKGLCPQPRSARGRLAGLGGVTWPGGRVDSKAGAGRVRLSGRRGG